MAVLSDVPFSSLQVLARATLQHTFPTRLTSGDLAIRAAFRSTLPLLHHSGLHWESSCQSMCDT